MQFTVAAAGLVLGGVSDSTDHSRSTNERLRHMFGEAVMVWVGELLNQVLEWEGWHPEVPRLSCAIHCRGTAAAGGRYLCGHCWRERGQHRVRGAAIAATAVGIRASAPALIICGF